jgi:Ceramidase
MSPVLQSMYTIPTRAVVGFVSLAILFGIAIGALLFLPAVPQKSAYHAFHDVRPLFGIPNGLNVLSNSAFTIVGLFGLAVVRNAQPLAISRELKPAYATLFAGIFLTALGSAIYHWRPTNATLIWDRLPMAIAFMALFATVIGERIAPRIGRAALLPLVIIGMASVFYWAILDDLRPYGVVQFFPILAIPVLIACMPHHNLGGSYLIGAIACYFGAKFLEEADGPIYALSHGFISGHTLKHLAAAFGAWLIVRMLVARNGGQH